MPFIMPPRSMTGFGAATARADAHAVTVEIRSVNHRLLDIRWHGSVFDSGPLTHGLERALRSRLARGRIDVRASLERTSGQQLVLQAERADRLIEQVRAVATQLDLRDDLTARSLLQLPGIFLAGAAEEDAGIGRAVEEAMVAALDQVVAMRQAEGEATEHDLRERLERIGKLAHGIEQGQEGHTRARAARLRERMSELIEGAELDPTRMAQEVALMADRADVSEELERLRSHVAQFGALLEREEPVGRRLDFLLQEMGREGNTIGSKSGGAAHEVVELKAELEKLKEQVQNLE